MGLGTERYTAGGITREQQDDIAMKSNERAANAIKDGRLADEIAPVSIPQRKGAEPILVETDEGVRPGTTMESLATLSPAFDKEGTITAANASQISDGGSRGGDDERAGASNARGVAPLGQVVSYGMVAGPDNASLLHQPSRAIKAALDTADKTVGDVDLFEINEAFAAVGIASMARPRDQRRDRQRQRWCDRPRPPDRHERQPSGADAVARAAASWRRPRRGRLVRRWRPRRRVTRS